MKKLTHKGKGYNTRKSRRGLNKRDKEFVPGRLGLNPNQPFYEKIEKEKEFIKRMKPKPSFTLMENDTEVVRYIAQLKNLIKERNKITRVLIDLRLVTTIDIGAICMLLSAIEELNLHSISISGNLPLNETCKKVFVDSGFLAHMEIIAGNFNVNTHNKNLIIKRGKAQTKSKELGLCVKKAVGMLTGEENHYPPVFGVLQELAGNSVEHGYFDKKEHWLIGVNQDLENRKVSFVLADNGFGILSTLNKQFGDDFFVGLALKDKSSILRRAFERKFSSRHDEQINRNKGLPLIRKIFDSGEITKLKVITNNVSLDFETNESHKLPVGHSGTFFYWEFDQNAILKWKSKSIT